MRGIVVPMIVALAAGSGCGGKPKSQTIPLPGGATLNYTPDGVTADRAHAVGRLLTREIGTFRWEGLLLHEPKGYVFGLFVPPDAVTDAGLAQWLRVIARDVSREACGGEPVHVLLMWLEGWNFGSGERVVLEHADYESDVLLVP